MHFIASYLAALVLLAGSGVNATPFAAQEEGHMLKRLTSLNTTEPTNQRNTQPPTSNNCGGRWGLFTNQAVLQDAIDQLDNRSGQSYHAANTCGAVTEPACYNGVRLGWCNGPVPNKGIYYGDLGARAAYTGNDCKGTGTFTGQTFYPDQTNFIVQAC